MEPIFLKPSYREKVWGGNRLETEFDFDIPSSNTGEAWVVSAHRNGSSIITSPQEYQGTLLIDFYEEHPEFFGPNHPEVFPLLVKILDANKPLSVQVHPDDEYGYKYENEPGKQECWYILHAEPGAKIIYGHNAETVEEFEKMVNDGDWDNLLREVPVKTGEFYEVPHGMFHAIGKGIMILETQQNSDTTYRVYDYDREDQEGNLRELHLEKAIDVVQVPSKPTKVNPDELSSDRDGNKVTHYLTNNYFTVHTWEVNSDLAIDLEKAYYLVTVLDGEGEFLFGKNSYTINKGMSFVIPYDVNHVNFKGNLKLIASYPEF